MYTYLQTVQDEVALGTAEMPPRNLNLTVELVDSQQPITVESQSLALVCPDTSNRGKFDSLAWSLASYPLLC